MKKETVEEFLFRGGNITLVPKQVLVEVPAPVKVSSTSDGHTMSLDEGAHFFAESRKLNKKVKVKALKDILSSYELPKEIADRLRGLDEHN